VRHRKNISLEVCSAKRGAYWDLFQRHFVHCWRHLVQIYPPWNFFSMIVTVKFGNIGRFRALLCLELSTQCQRLQFYPGPWCQWFYRDVMLKTSWQWRLWSKGINLGMIWNDWNKLGKRNWSIQVKCHWYFLDIEYIELGFGTRQYTPQKTATFTYISTFENIFFWLEILTVQSRSVGDWHGAFGTSKMDGGVQNQTICWSWNCTGAMSLCTEIL